MMNGTRSVYQQIADRTGGDIYLGIVGPVRTGKSTFVKRVMETLVIPNIDNIYQKERATDELPQSGSGRTIMTSEPKFVPENAVEISPDGVSKLSIRMIDSVGYMIPSALGAEEEGRPRMVTTPWYPQEIPMTQAAELGTKKIMDEHCTVGIIITTDGSIHDIPREDFIEAEQRAICDMCKTGKPFIVLINSVFPEGEQAQKIKEELETEYKVSCLCTNCLALTEAQISDLLSCLLQQFPLKKVNYYLPKWLDTLPIDHPIKENLYKLMLSDPDILKSFSKPEALALQLQDTESVSNVTLKEADLGLGTASYEISFCEDLFYEILTQCSGFDVKNNADLLELLTSLSKIKTSYDKISDALEQVQATGYGIVMPTPDEMHLEVPQIIRKGSNYGVKLKASAPSIHMMRADIQAEINPIVGDEKQSEELLQYLIREYEDDTKKLWESNIFGKSVYELVNEGLGSKLKRMPEEARFKLQSTLSRIINEGSSGLLCIIFA